MSRRLLPITFAGILLLACGASKATAQRPSIAHFQCPEAADEAALVAGTVADSKTGRAVPAVLVWTSAVQFCGEFSDSLGHFRIRVPPGHQNIGTRARAGFHKAELQEITVAPGDSIRLAFVLPRDPEYLREPPALVPEFPPAPWPDYFYNASLDEFLQVAGLERLDRKALPREHREIRVWSGLAIGSPDELVILREANGIAEGEAIRYWHQPVDETDGLDSDLTARFGPTCKRIERGDWWVICYSQFSTQPDWAGLLADATAEQVWQLPDPFGLYYAWRVTDGWSMTIELRDGPEYRAFEYNNPDAYDWPETRHAVVLMEIFNRPWQWVSNPVSPSP